jgi:hypothetical protein
LTAAACVALPDSRRDGNAVKWTGLSSCAFTVKDVRLQLRALPQFCDRDAHVLALMAEDRVRDA